MANRVLELLSSIYNRAIEWGYRSANPTGGIKPFKETKRDRFIQGSELPRFFIALAEDTSDDFKHFVLLSLLTGARRNNVLAMRWQDELRIRCHGAVSSVVAMRTIACVAHAGGSGTDVAPDNFCLRPMDCQHR